MCGRFTLTISGKVLAEVFDTDTIPDFEPRFNIAPTQTIPVLVAADGEGRQWLPTRWGLVPFWSKDIKIGSKLINARSETAATKPAFRAAVKRRRCLVPSDGFYEWKKQGSSRQPHHISFTDRRVFAFGGLWESWNDGQGNEILSFTILTTKPNEVASRIHDRMPVILSQDDHDEWLQPNELDSERFAALTSPFPATDMVARPVSTAVNNVRNDTPEILETRGQQSLF